MLIPPCSVLFAIIMPFYNNNIFFTIKLYNRTVVLSRRISQNGAHIMLIFCEFGESGNKSHESVGTFIQMEKNKNIYK